MGGVGRCMGGRKARGGERGEWGLGGRVLLSFFSLFGRR